MKKKKCERQNDNNKNRQSRRPKVVLNNGFEYAV